MKIYVVTKGNYSDYHIVAATLVKERAEEIAKRFSDKWEECNIEEYEDSEAALKPYWNVKFKNGISECVSVGASSYVLRYLNDVEEYEDGRLDVSVAADTPEEAIKIAAEKCAEYLAKKEGIC